MLDVLPVYGSVVYLSQVVEILELAGLHIVAAFQGGQLEAPLLASRIGSRVSDCDLISLSRFINRRRNQLERARTGVRGAGVTFGASRFVWCAGVTGWRSTGKRFGGSGHRRTGEQKAEQPKKGQAKHSHLSSSNVLHAETSSLSHKFIAPLVGEETNYC